MSKTSSCLQFETNSSWFWTALREPIRLAQECLYKLGYKKTIPSLKLKGASEIDAEDIFQEGITAFFLRLESLTPDASPTTVLYRIIHNKWIDEIRRRKGGNSTDGIEELPIPDPDPDPLTHLVNEEMQEELQAAISTLGDDQKILLYKLYYEQKKSEEVATEMRIEVKWVYNQRYRIIQQLRQWMTGGKKS